MNNFRIAQIFLLLFLEQNQNKYLPAHCSDQSQSESQTQSQNLCMKTKGEGLISSMLIQGHCSVPPQAALFLCDLGPYPTSCYSVKQRQKYLTLHRGIVREINIKVWEVLKHYRDRDKISTVPRKKLHYMTEKPKQQCFNL